MRDQRDVRSDTFDDMRFPAAYKPFGTFLQNLPSSYTMRRG